MSQVTDDIKARLNIVDLVGDYVQLQKTGVNYKARCPFHNEKTPSFTVSEEKQIWHCFGCGKGGDAFGFLMEIEGLEFKEALKNLAERVGVELPRYNYNPQVKQTKDKTLEILELATKFYEKQLWEGAGKNKILNYLRERGLTDETIKEFRIGYAPDGWRNIMEFLTEREYTIDDILKTGLLVKKSTPQMADSNHPITKADCYDRFRNRIIFPITDIMGKPIGYTARVAPGDDESQAKYVNTPETAVYHKSKILYGIDKAKMSIKQTDEVLLVEGNMDVIASWQAGIKNVVAVSGTALTEEQLNILKRYTDNLKMFFDMDEAGQKAAQKSAMTAWQKDFNIKIVATAKGKDASDMVRENKDDFLQAIDMAIPAMEYFANKIIAENDKNIPEGKKNIVAKTTPLIVSFSSQIDRDYWVKELAQRLDIEENIVIDAVGQAIEKGGRFSRYDDNEKNNGKVEDNILLQEDRGRNIQIEAMGLLLSDELLWKKVAKKYGKDIQDTFSNKKIVDVILDKGRKFNFNFEKILDDLSDKEQKFLRKLYFTSLEKNTTIETITEKLKIFENYIKELQKENNKLKIKKIIVDIKKAEKVGDKEKVKLLSDGLRKIMTNNEKIGGI